ncbi:hypothetical protein ACFYW9_19160 [Streptomyces sp. NPDC002698]|uniref:hypothetical protein n=1 Tax=Streptomyces sp. NPDC002698 TaxID=3364660 RepID=UPI0036B26E7C
MGKGSTAGSVSQTKTLPDDRVGCHSLWCEAPATRWIDMERYGHRRWLSTSYCDEHGDWELRDPFHTMRVRKIEEV